MSDITIPAQGWKPRPYQLPLVKYMIPETRGLRAAVAWHRRAGKDLTCLNIAAIKSMQRVGTYVFIGPYQNQVRRIIWDGMDGEGKKFIDAWPKELITRKNEAEMRIHLATGSVIQLLGADNPDKLVGINPVGIVFSEFSLCDPTSWKLTNPILAENGGWAIFNGTPRGQNHFYHMLNRAKSNPDWFASHLTAVDTKAISPEELKKAREELNNEALFQSEFMTSFNTPVDGAYYGEQISKLYKMGHILPDLSPDPALSVHTAWDLGMDDSTTIWLYQLFRKEVRVVGYYENSGEGLAHYVQFLNRWQALRDVSFGRHYFPHDIKVRELGSGRSRIETLRSLGLKAEVVKKLPLADGIEAVRQVLPMCWFAEKECSLGIEHLKSYRKEFDSMRNVFRKTPVHDRASHGADGFRTLALAIKQTNQTETRRSPATYAAAEPTL